MKLQHLILLAALMAGPAFKDPRTHQTTQGGRAGAMPYMLAVTDLTNLLIAVAGKGTGATGIVIADSGELAKNHGRSAPAAYAGLESQPEQATAIEVVNAGVNVISHGNGFRLVPQIFSAVAESGTGKSFWTAFFPPPAADLINAMLKNNTILDATVLTTNQRDRDSSIPKIGDLPGRHL